MNHKDIIKDLVGKSNIVSSVAELERKLGISNGTINKWNKANPSIESLTKISKFFDVSIDYLLGITDKLEPEKTILSIDLDKILDTTVSFNGNPLTNSDKEAIRAYLQGRFSN